MLNLKTNELNGRKKTRTTKGRQGDRLADESKGNMALELAPEDCKQLLDALDDPSPPTDYALKLRTKYRRLVVNAE